MVVAFSYGYLSFGGLKTLLEKNMVTGLPQITAPSQICEECVVDKQHRSQFPKGKSWRANHVLELVHSNICGPIRPISNGDKMYLLPSLTIILERLGCIFGEKNQRLLMYLKASKLMWRMRQERPSRVSEQNVEANIALRDLKNFVGLMAFEKSSQRRIHHNKMVYRRGRIEPFSTWFEAC